MFSKACRYILLFSFVFLFTAAGAQKSIPLFFEKVYLHTDRAFYAGGDDIWFKAYTVNARTNNASDASGNLYVELFGPDANLIKREIIHLETGLGKGDFKLSDNAVGGTYHIRAYTNWMKNFGNNFFFEKDIQVAAVASSSSTAKVDKKKSNVKISSTAAEANSIQFFPEGGTLVAGINSLVSFKALNSAGKGTDAKGAVVSEKGDTVARFATTYLGMGSFNFTPIQDVDYKAIVTFKDGTKSSVDMPSVYATGYVLSVTQEDTCFVINVLANAATIAANPSKEFILAARNTGKLLYKEKVALKDGKTSVKIGKSIFPAGIAAFTVYDDKLRPNAERLVYAENKSQQIKVSVTTDKGSYQAKEKVTLNITATDINNQPIETSLSLAAIDEGLVQSSFTNIASYVMLESEIKGNIENPAAYFDEKNTQRFQQLDLLLRTQGWRDFVWRKLADTTYSIKYLPEPGISLSGSVKALFGKQLLPDMNITLMASGAKGSKIYFTKTDSSGKYFLDGLPLYGNQPIKISSKNDKGKKGGMIMLDTLKEPAPFFASVTPIDETKEIKQFAEEARKRWATEKKAIGEDITMPDVVVTSKVTPTVARDGSVETNFGYSFAAKINPEDKQFGTLENYLIHKTSAVADVEAEGVNYQINGKLVRPNFVVDNREDYFERMDYYAIPIDQVISVNLNQTVSNSGGGFTDKIIIRITLKPGAYNQDLALLITDVEGYYEARTFYAPTYYLSSEKIKQDSRTTIFWEPFITTNANGKATVSFFNADAKTKIKVSVQGLSNKGKPVATATEYLIK